ncbi:hypothetical protein Plhal304r1_c042g0122171 [Plasmopara halstedii]
MARTPSAASSRKDAAALLGLHVFQLSFVGNNSKPVILGSLAHSQFEVPRCDFHFSVAVSSRFPASSTEYRSPEA